MKGFIYTLTAVSLIIIVQSCSIIYGIHSKPTSSINQVSNYFKKTIETDAMYYLDSLYYKQIMQMNITNSKVVKNHLQPIQALYFDKTGKLTSYFVNCYANPKNLNLNWNENKVFENSLPKGNAPLDSLFNYEGLLKLLVPLIRDDLRVNYDEKVIVIWNNYFKRYSKSLIRQVKRNQILFPKKVIYVNNDLLLAYLMKKK